MKTVDYKELITAMEDLEKEKGLKKEYLIESLENQLLLFIFTSGITLFEAIRPIIFARIPAERQFITVPLISRKKVSAPAYLFRSFVS